MSLGSGTRKVGLVAVRLSTVMPPMRAASRAWSPPVSPEVRTSRVLADLEQVGGDGGVDQVGAGEGVQYCSSAREQSDVGASCSTCLSVYAAVMVMPT